eukprot:GHVU01115245.1.p1 GENE.GHVU01115245.1~~GHVU01115245.1.p1  ORF type:complete len:216 (-),score=39.10 GHVU01115245.1:257-904(-)
MDQVIETQLIQAAQMVEDQLDAEIGRLDHMDETEMEQVRQRRIQQMKKAHDQKQEYLQQGHGQYEEIADEPEFFATCKKSKKVVCHFYRDSTFRCQIVDKHIALLAPKHLETKFVKINAEKVPFLVERLRIKVLPTICLAKDGKTVDYVVGFDDLGGTDEFPTEMLEWRIAQAAVINYSGDLLTPPTCSAAKKQGITYKKKTIRGRDDDDSDSDY